MNLLVEGIVTKVLPLQSGTSKSGNAWKKLEFVVTTQEQYSKNVCLSVMNDKVDQFSPLLKENAQVQVSFDAESRSFTDRNGVERYSTELRAYKIEPLGAAPQSNVNYDQQAQAFFNSQPTPPQAQFQQPAFQSQQQGYGGGYNGGNFGVPPTPQGMPGFGGQPMPQPTNEPPF